MQQSQSQPVLRLSTAVGDAGGAPLTSTPTSTTSSRGYARRRSQVIDKVAAAARRRRRRSKAAPAFGGAGGAAADNTSTFSGKSIGEQVLHAATAGDVAALKQLVKKASKAELETADKISGDTPLIASVRQGNPECCSVLIEAGASVTSQNKAGVTALHYAAKFGLLKCAADLLSSGAVWNCPNNNRRTPAYWGHAAHQYDLAHAIEAWGAGRKAKALDILLERNAAVVNNKDWEPDASEIARARQRRSGAAVTSKRGARPRPPPAPPALPPAPPSGVAARAAALGRRLLATPPPVPPLPSTPPASGGAAGAGAGFGSAAAPVDTVRMQQLEESNRALQAENERLKALVDALQKQLASHQYTAAPPASRPD